MSILTPQLDPATADPATAVSLRKTISRDGANAAFLNELPAVAPEIGASFFGSYLRGAGSRPANERSKPPILISQLRSL